MAHLGSFAEEFNKHLERTNQKIDSIQEGLDKETKNIPNQKKLQPSEKNTLNDVKSVDFGAYTSGESTNNLFRVGSEEKRRLFLKATYDIETLDWKDPDDVQV